MVPKVFLKRGDDKNAFEELKKVLDLAIVAFTKVKKFDDKVKCKWLSIFCRMMTLSYKAEEEKFLPLDKVSKENKELIAELAFNDLTELMDKFEGMNVSWSREVHTYLVTKLSVQLILSLNMTIGNPAFA